MSRHHPSRSTVVKRFRPRARMHLVLVSMVAGLMVVAGASPASATVIAQDGQGPLDRIEITPDLNCAVDHVLDEAGEFFGDTACGTLLTAGETLFGPASIPAGGGASPRTAFTPVSQTGVTGSGTAADPFTIVTDVDLGETGLHITQTDSYVNGQESYRTDVTVSNTGVDAMSAILYRAGDCFLQDSDSGFGSVDPATGAVACVNGVIDPETEQIVPGDRIIQWLPISGGSSFLEDGFDTVWSTIGSQQSFPNTCRCDEFIDNGAGLSWNLTVPASGSVTRSHLTTFSPEGTQPLTTTKTADSPTAEAGSTDGYTITISNPNATPVPLDSIFDTLPSGFTYIPGSTTGMTTSDPTIDGQTLTWSEPGTVPAEDSASLHFQVTVSSTPGTYTNSAGATAGSFSVAPTGPTAPITVTAPEEEPEADLSLTKSDDAPFGPDPVSSGGTVAYVLSVSNAGPDTATGVSVFDAPEGGTVTSASGSGWTCDIDTEANTVTCDLASSLGSEETAEDLLVQVEAPESAEDTSISDTATVSGAETDPAPANNTDVETTTVTGSSNPETTDHAQTFYDGTQEVTLETTRDTAGGFYSRLVIPPGLEPGVVTIDEFPADGSEPIPGVPNPATFCGERPCDRQIQVTVLPGGRTSMTEPIQVFWFYTGMTTKTKAYVKGDDESVASAVRVCRNPGIAKPPKCLDSITDLPNGDLQYLLLWRDGGDPVGAKRR